MRGSGAYLINGRKIEIARQAILWLFPGQDHILLEQSPDFAMWILLVKPDYLRQICTDDQTSRLLEENPPGNFCRYLTERQAKKLWEECQEITAIENQLAYFNAGLGYILLSAWVTFQEASMVSLGEDVHPSVEKAARLIHNGLHGDDLTSLAKKVGLSPQRLSRLFKQQTAVSITDFRNNCRLQRFLDLYEYGQTRTMMDAALEAGFGSYAQFYRIFRQSTGIAPATYARKLKHLNPAKEHLTPINQT
jgi:AraC-like DNA-binding protein